MVNYPFYIYIFECHQYHHYLSLNKLSSNLKYLQPTEIFVVTATFSSFSQLVVVVVHSTSLHVLELVPHMDFLQRRVIRLINNTTFRQ